MFSDEMSSSATVLILLSPCVSINFFFWTPFSFFSDFCTYQVHLSVFWALNRLCHLPYFFEFLIFVYFWMLWILVTVNKVKHIALHGLHASQITSTTLVTQNLFRVTNEIGWILVSRFLGNNSLEELLAVRRKKRLERKGVEKKQTRTATAKLFALHTNATRIVIITFLKFSKFTGNLLAMSSDITSFWSKEKNAYKIVQLNPILVFESKYILEVTCWRG